MSLLGGHTHKYRQHADQQLVCVKCGQLKKGHAPRGGIFHSHKWTMDRKTRRLYCGECGVTR